MLYVSLFKNSVDATCFCRAVADHKKTMKTQWDRPTEETPTS
jgi:hypothetical protein